MCVRGRKLKGRVQSRGGEVQKGKGERGWRWGKGIGEEVTLESNARGAEEVAVGVDGDLGG